MSLSPFQHPPCIIANYIITTLTKDWPIAKSKAGGGLRLRVDCRMEKSCERNYLKRLKLVRLELELVKSYKAAELNEILNIENTRQCFWDCWGRVRCGLIVHCWFGYGADELSSQLYGKTRTTPSRHDRLLFLVNKTNKRLKFYNQEIHYIQSPLYGLDNFKLDDYKIERKLAVYFVLPLALT